MSFGFEGLTTDKLANNTVIITQKWNYKYLQDFFGTAINTLRFNCIDDQQSMTISPHQNNRNWTGMTALVSVTSSI